MPLPTVLSDLSTTAASNYPAGSDSPTVLDDVQRAHAAFIAQLRDGTGFTAGVNFVSGTRMPFAQAAAPTGWTQDTSDNATNRMLRVVNTAGNGVGGSASPILNNVVPAHTHGFTTGWVSADHAHGVSDPGHKHQFYQDQLTNAGGGLGMGGGGAGLSWQDTTVVATGISLGGISSNHSHSGSTDNGSSQTNWVPRYIDMIICAKN